MGISSSLRRRMIGGGGRDVCVFGWVTKDFAFRWLNLRNSWIRSYSSLSYLFFVSYYCVYFILCN